MTILRAGGLGDLLTAVPALRALARAFPGHRRLLIGPRALAPLLPLIVEEDERCIDELVECEGLDADPGALPGWPELAVNLHGRGPESHQLLLSTGPVRLIAFRHDEIPETASMPRWRHEEDEAERWCGLLRDCGIPADSSQLEINRPALHPPAPAGGATLVHPGKTGHASAQRWAELAATERKEGREVLVSGSSGEAELARYIAVMAGLPSSSVLAGQTDLVTLAAHIGAAAVVICGDPDIAHLATALGVPSLLFFSPTSPEHPRAGIASAPVTDFEATERVRPKVGTDTSQARGRVHEKVNKGVPR
jgi:ADP-heptose:LPS heptosyltransferase